MRRITILLLLLPVFLGYSQVKGYTFSQSIKSYNEITGGTSLGDTSTDNQYFVDPNDPAGYTTITGPGFPIGFSFVFNGNTYDRFGVSADGWIALGSTLESLAPVNMSVSSSTYPISSNSVQGLTDLLSSRIAALGGNLQAQSDSSIRFQTIGTSPNRILVIQWKNFKKQGSNGIGDSFNFQIRLNENSGIVNFHYGSFVSNATPNSKFQVGMRAENSETPTNLLNRASTGSWDASTAGTAKTDSMLMSNTLKPATGLSFNWTPPTCGGARSVVASDLKPKSAALSWTSFLPIPNSYEYVVTTSSVLPVGSGTAVTGITVNVFDLEPNTTYKVYMRSKCNDQLTSWELMTTFKTKCLDVSYFYEDFDSYNTSSIIPDCWSKNGSTGMMNITTGSETPGSAPNKLMMQGDASVKTVAYAILPSMSNLHDGTHRLRFKAYSYTYGPARTIEIGYFTDPANVATFTPLQTPIDISSTISQFKEFSFVPGILPEGIKNLGIRNSGNSNSQTLVYLDDVIWEPDPTCGYVKSLNGKNVTHNSVNVSWDKADNESLWQYVYDKSTVKSPYDLNPIDVPGNNPQLLLSGLEPATTYKIWIRSKCHETSLGGWVGPIVIQTTCTPVSEFAENFDQSTDLPICWKQLGSTGSASISKIMTLPTPSVPNTLSLTGYTEATPAMVTLPALSNATAGTHRVKFKGRASVAGVKLDIGYLTDVRDISTFHYLQSVTINSADTFNTYSFNLGSEPKSNFLALKVPGTPGGVVYIDDVVWEPVSTCPEISNLTVTYTKTNSVSLSWSAGANETKWQYVLSNPEVVNPYSLQNIIDVPNPLEVGNLYKATIVGLDSSKTYKIWLRSKCNDQSLGSWIGPIVFSTPCASVTEFSQKFDASQSLPVCWSNSGSSGFTGIGSVVSGDLPPSSPNALIMGTNAVVAMPAVSNTTNKTHRLKFKFRGLNGGEKLEVGYLKIFTDPSTFVSLNSYYANDNFKSVTDELMDDLISEVLAFRSSSTVYLDDVSWEMIPPCTDVSDLKILNVTDKTADISWKAENQSSWQYVKSDSPDSDPNTLLIKDVLNVSTLELTDLVQNTVNYVWVRSKCSTLSNGAWIGPLKIQTNCSPVTTLDEKFEYGGLFPDCWRKVGSQGDAHIVPNITLPSEGFELFMNSDSETAPAVVAFPALSNLNDPNFILKFKVKGNAIGLKLDLGYLTNVNDPSSFVLEKQFAVTKGSISELKTYALQTPLQSGILAFRNSGTLAGSIYIDDVKWVQKPVSAPSCMGNITVVPDTNCGNYATYISWDSMAEADGYLIDIGTQSGVADVINDKDLQSALKYMFIGNYNTTYYVKVKPYNFSGSRGNCDEYIFKTNENGCYCVSIPSTNVELGITNVQLSGKKFVNPDVTYKSFVNKPVNVAAGQKNELLIKFNTGTKGCYVFAWVDFNDDYYFNESEIIYNGVSAATSPNVLDASFLIPASANIGEHMMRIVTFYSPTFVEPDPCYSGPNGVTLDFRLNIINTIQNDIPAGAINLTTGKDFAEYALTGTNLNATGSPSVIEPACGDYEGADVWYSAIIPSSGNLTFELKTVENGIDDLGAAVYSGIPGDLKLESCMVTSNTGGNTQPKVVLTGRTPNEKMYLRVWENGGDAYGSFQVSAYDNSTLGVDAFETDNFRFYPNPVENILNISMDQEITEIVMMNLIGQQIMNVPIYSTQVKIDMSFLSKGTYLVKVFSGNQSKLIKVVKK